MFAFWNEVWEMPAGIKPGFIPGAERSFALVLTIE